MKRKKTGEIRSDIARTRDEMDATINEIRERLSPDELTRQAKNKFRIFAGGKAGQMAQNAREGMVRMGSGVVETIKDNPIPAALLGIGVGLLIAGAFRGGGDGRGKVVGTGEEMHFQAGDLFDGRKKGYQEEIAETARQAKGKLSRKMEEVASDMGEKGAAWHAQAAEYFKNIGGSAQERLSSLGSGLSRVIDENPLAAIAAALALGAAVGLSIPAACREEKIQM